MLVEKHKLIKPQLPGILGVAEEVQFLIASNLNLLDLMQLRLMCKNMRDMVSRIPKKDLLRVIQRSFYDCYPQTRSGKALTKSLYRCAYMLGGTELFLALYCVDGAPRYKQARQMGFQVDFDHEYLAVEKASCFQLIIDEDWIDVAKAILDSGVRDERGKFFIHFAAVANNTQLVRLILKNRWCLPAPAENDALEWAVRHRNMEMTVVCLESGVYTGDSVCCIRSYPLYVACMSGQARMVRLLMRHGIDNVTEAVYGAIDGGHTDMLFLLIDEKYAEFSKVVATIVRKLSEDSESILHKLFEIYQGRDPNGETGDALLVAAQNGLTDVVAMILEHPGTTYDYPIRILAHREAHPELHDYTWEATPLRHACMGGHSQIVQLILNDGREAPDETAISLAGQFNHGQALHELLMDKRVLPVLAARFD
eukprot:CFRG4834T1